MSKLYWSTPILAIAMLSLLGLESCRALNEPKTIVVVRTPASSPDSTPFLTANVTPAIALTMVPSTDQALLKQSWEAYRQRFIQSDGRVIDLEAGDRSTSEGQAYAMLRAVMIGDRDAFDRTLKWAEENLVRTRAGKKTDSLWSWKWGKSDRGAWGILDANFASDGDIDAITALILASRRWQHRPYLALAQGKLQDLWSLSTITDFRAGTQQRRYLMPGPAAAFQKQSILQLNPSYFAPAAFRLFAQVDAAHNWLSLIDSSYHVLDSASTLSSVGLPNDWVAVDLTTGSLQALTTPNPGTSEYSFDAYRVWWRVATDADWFGEPRARSFLRKHLKPIEKIWRSQQKIPARIDLQGKSTVSYDATSQYGMLYNAFRLIDPLIAKQIRQKKIAPTYKNGFWDNPSAYYTQNLVWLGLAPAAPLAPWLKP